jgi:hypothetical protein
MLNSVGLVSGDYSRKDESTFCGHFHCRPEQHVELQEVLPYSDVQGSDWGHKGREYDWHSQ